MAYQVIPVKLTKDTNDRKNFVEFFNEIKNIAIEEGAKPEDCYFSENTFWIPKVDAMNATPFECYRPPVSVASHWSL